MMDGWMDRFIFRMENFVRDEGAESREFIIDIEWDVPLLSRLRMKRGIKNL